MSTIEYLKRYERNIEIIDSDALKNYQDFIPHKWLDILSESE